MMIKEELKQIATHEKTNEKRSCINLQLTHEFRTEIEHERDDVEHHRLRERVDEVGGNRGPVRSA